MVWAARKPRNPFRQSTIRWLSGHFVANRPAVAPVAATKAESASRAGRWGGLDGVWSWTTASRRDVGAEGSQAASRCSPRAIGRYCGRPNPDPPDPDGVIVRCEERRDNGSKQPSSRQSPENRRRRRPPRRWAARSGRILDAQGTWQSRWWSPPRFAARRGADAGCTADAAVPQSGRIGVDDRRGPGPDHGTGGLRSRPAREPDPRRLDGIDHVALESISAPMATTSDCGPVVEDRRLASPSGPRRLAGATGPHGAQP